MWFNKGVKNEDLYVTLVTRHSVRYFESKS